MATNEPTPPWDHLFHPPAPHQGDIYDDYELFRPAGAPTNLHQFALQLLQIQPARLCETCSGNRETSPVRGSHVDEDDLQSAIAFLGLLVEDFDDPWTSPSSVFTAGGRDRVIEHLGADEAGALDAVIERVALWRALDRQDDLDFAFDSSDLCGLTDPCSCEPAEAPTDPSSNDTDVIVRPLSYGLDRTHVRPFEKGKTR